MFKPQPTLVEFNKSDHVTNEQLSYALKKAGIVQRSCFYWRPYVAQGAGNKPKREVALVNPPSPLKIDDSTEIHMQPCSAFITSELSMILPESIPGENKEHPLYRLVIEKVPLGYNVAYRCVGCGGCQFQIIANRQPDALGEILHTLIKQKRIIITNKL